MLKIFIGYDSKEDDAYHVCADSLRRHSSIPLGIMPLRLKTLREMGHYTRPEDEPASTEFAFSRFLVPFLCGYKSFALFLDCDFLITQDIAKMLTLADPAAAINCVKHDYVPKAAFKMDGEPQVAYPRKNWSSFMLFNNAKCEVLTKEYVNTASAQDLHRFAWLEDDQIMDLPQQWNWLEGEFDWASIIPPAAIHFTNGGPWHVNHKAVRFGDLWLKALQDITVKSETKQ